MNTQSITVASHNRRAILRDLPALMRHDLRECSTFKQAELVFECWNDLHAPVPETVRGWIWLHA